MKFKEIDEQAAMEYFDMLKDAPSIKEILETYPGVDNLMHVMTACSWAECGPQYFVFKGFEFFLANNIHNLYLPNIIIAVYFVF